MSQHSISTSHWVGGGVEFYEHVDAARAGRGRRETRRTAVGGRATSSDDTPASNTN